VTLNTIKGVYYGNLVLGFSNESHAKSREPRPSSLKREWRGLPSTEANKWQLWKNGAGPTSRGGISSGDLFASFSFTILFGKEVSGMCMGVGGALLTLLVGIKSGGN
jgi:hypothetical protein